MTPGHLTSRYTQKSEIQQRGDYLAIELWQESGLSQVKFCSRETSATKFCHTRRIIKKPKDKALMENQVKKTYSRVYARLRNQRFFDLHSLNKAIGEKMKDHNQTRMQRIPSTNLVLLDAPWISNFAP